MTNKAYHEAIESWWESDWSWEGLADKYCASKPTVSLQEYWAAEKKHLIRFAGRRWTRFHLPMRDTSLRASPKQTWSSEEVDRFNREIAAKIEAAPRWDAATREQRLPSPGDPEFEVHLCGVVFPTEWRLKNSVLPGIDLFGAVFERGFSIVGSQVAGHLRLATAVSRGPVKIANSGFCGTVYVRAALLLDDVIVGPRVKFHNDVFFKDGVFANRSYFVDGLFTGRASFWRADFVDDAVFLNSEFRDYASFRNCSFRSEARFDCVSGEPLPSSLHEAIAGEVRPAHFFGRLNMSGDDGLKFGSDANFSGVKFQDEADFHGRQFCGKANFSRASFGGLPNFHECKLPADADFTEANFSARGGSSNPGVHLWYRSRRRLARSWGYVRGAVRPECGSTSDDKFDAELENAYRTLRKMSRDHGHFDRELKFAAYENDARSRRHDIPFSDVLAIWSFKAFSDYSQSLWRPLFAWLIGGFGLILLGWIIERLLGMQPVAFPAFFHLVAAKFFPPAGWSKAELDTLPISIAPLFLHILAAAQAAWTALMLTLLAFAVRRRFVLN